MSNSRRTTAPRREIKRAPIIYDIRSTPFKREPTARPTVTKEGAATTGGLNSHGHTQLRIPDPSVLLNDLQRSVTGLRSGWFDYEFLFEATNTSSKKFIENSVDQGLDLNHFPIGASYRSEINHWARISTSSAPSPSPSPSPAPSPSPSSNLVIHLTSPPPGYGRMPNYTGIAKSMRSADVIISFPVFSTWFTCSSVLERIQGYVSVGPTRSGRNPPFFAQPVPETEDPKPIRYLAFIVPRVVPAGDPGFLQLGPNGGAKRAPTVEEHKANIKKFSETTPGVFYFEVDFESRKEVQDVMKSLGEVCLSGREGIAKKQLPKPQVQQLQQQQLQQQQQPLELLLEQPLELLLFELQQQAPIAQPQVQVVPTFAQHVESSLVGKEMKPTNGFATLRFSRSPSPDVYAA